MDFTAILIAMASMGGLGIIFSTGLSIANIKLHVDEDPRIAEIMEELPGANTQGKTLDEARENLKEAVELILLSNRELSEKTLKDKKVIKEEINITT